MNNKKVMKIVSGILLIVACLFLLSTISQAASFSASISKTTVTVGDTFTVTVNANNAAGMYSVTNSNSNVSVSSGSKSEFLENGKATITFKAVKAGTVTITASADDMSDLDDDTKAVRGSKSFTVTIKGKSSSSNQGSNSGTSSKPTKPTFQSRNETVYATGDVNVRSSYSTSSSVLATLKKGDSVTRTGRATEYINGVLWSKVTYNGQTAYMSSDLLTTTKPAADKKEEDKKEDKNKDEDKKSDNKNLKSLTITPEGLSPKFAANVTEYAMSVGSSTKKLEIEAVPEDENAKVNISGNTDLENGENTVEIVVTAADGTSKTYKIVVTKEEKGQLKLKELLIEGLPLQPEFNSDVYEYTLALDKNNITELNITATPNKEDAEVEVVGNADLKIGANIITILVKSNDGKENATYQVTVNIPEKASGFTFANTDLYKYIGIGAAIVILLIIIIVAIKKHKNNKEDDFSDYYGEHNVAKDVSNEDENFNSLKELKKETKTEEVDDLPKLYDEDLPKSLRKKHEESDEKEDRKVQLDDLYSTDNDISSNRKRGKHF